MKKILKYLFILIITVSFAASAVSASDLVEHDFGEFTALSPNGVEYEEETTEMYRYYLNLDEGIAYFYMNSLFVNNDTISMAYYRLNEMGFEKVNTTGNLTIFEVKNGSFSNYVEYAVEVHTDGKLLCVAGNNSNELEEIGNSVKFN